LESIIEHILFDPTIDHAVQRQIETCIKLGRFKVSAVTRSIVTKHRFLKRDLSKVLSIVWLKHDSELHHYKRFLQDTFSPARVAGKKSRDIVIHVSIFSLVLAQRV
jgi:hypothetical protein